MLHGINKDRNCSCSKGARCKSSGKHPIYLSWEKRATTCEEKIIADFKKYPYANIGFATGDNFFVIDIDKDHGGYESIKKYGILKETVSVRTGSGGSHHYYSMPQKVIIPNRVAILPGVDIRAKGGLVVAPDSTHKNSNNFRWVGAMKSLQFFFHKTAAPSRVNFPRIKQGGIGKNGYIRHEHR